MSRDIPFNPDAECDECGNLGAFDYMGDFLCDDCYNHELMELWIDEDQRCYYSDPASLKDIWGYFVEWLKRKLGL